MQWRRITQVVSKNFQVLCSVGHTRVLLKNILHKPLWPFVQKESIPLVKTAVRKCGTTLEPEFGIARMTPLGEDFPGQRVLFAFYPIVDKDESTKEILGIFNKFPPRIELITKRERDILLLLADGLAPCEIGNQLALATSTIHTHLGRIRDKLELLDLLQVATWAVTYYDLLLLALPLLENAENNWKNCGTS